MILPRVDTIGAAERASLAEFLEAQVKLLEDELGPPDEIMSMVATDLRNLCIAFREANDVRATVTINDYDESVSPGGLTIRSGNN